MSELIKHHEIISVLPDGSREQGEKPLLREHSLKISVNGEQRFNIICTGEYIKELTVGRLLTEGLIGSAQDIESLVTDKDGHTAEVVLKSDPINTNEYHKLPQATWSDGEIFALAKRFSEGTQMHHVTQCTHSCFLAKGSELLFCCEDIGRHNAVDKAVGHAVLNGIDLSGCMLFTSGRVPTDMVMKTVAAGIPVLVSKSVPTAESVETAHKYGLTLICRAYPDRFEIY